MPTKPICSEAHPDCSYLARTTLSSEGVTGGAVLRELSLKSAERMKNEWQGLSQRLTEIAIRRGEG